MEVQVHFLWVFFSLYGTASSLSSEVTTPKNRSVYQGHLFTSFIYTNTHTRLWFSRWTMLDKDVKQFWMQLSKISTQLDQLENAASSRRAQLYSQPQQTQPGFLHICIYRSSLRKSLAMVVKCRLTHLNPIQKKPNAAELNSEQTAHIYRHTHTHQSWYNRVKIYKMTSFFMYMWSCLHQEVWNAPYQQESISTGFSFRCSHRRRFMLLILHSRLFFNKEKWEKKRLEAFVGGFQTSTLATVITIPMITDCNNTYNNNNREKSLCFEARMWCRIVITTRRILHRVVATIHRLLKQKHVILVSIFSVQSSLTL